MIVFDRKNLPDEILISLYKSLLKPRLVEEKMLILLRQNEISKWFSGIGQEGIAVGAAAALNEDEYILPLHRNLGVFTGRNISLRRLFAQFQGKPSGFTKGRDRSFHFGSAEHHIVGMISHLGPQMAVADGIALAAALGKEKKVTLTFCGDGGSSEGDFHESLNLAAVWSLPVIFLVENNGYSLSTPNQEQFKFNSFTDKGPAYGIEALRIDGNNILEVYHTIKEIAEDLREKPRPVLIEAMSFRMRGHEEASGTKYVPQELFEEWAQKDPVENYERFLFEEGVINFKQISEFRTEIKEEIEQAWKQVVEEPLAASTAAQELHDMYAPWTVIPQVPRTQVKTKMRYLDAISNALHQSMERFPKLVLMGQDIAEYGGVFKVTDGMVKQYGKERVRNTPLCESAVLGAGLGLAIQGYKSVIEMQFADFVTCGFNQIINNLAKSHYRWGQNADVVVRMPTGAGTGAGPFHSQSTESWFFHTPGLKIVYPSTPYDAKGLLNAAIEDPNPVMYFEHKALYRSISDEVPEEYYTLPIGQARIAREGEMLTVVTYGQAVHWSIKAAEQLGADVEIIDLRSLLPWDKEAVENSVKKTGRALVVSEDTFTGSICAEIAAWISENCFAFLDAPVMREGSLDTAVPFSVQLEKVFLPEIRIKEKMQTLMEF